MSARTSFFTWSTSVALLTLSTGALAQEGKTFPECTRSPTDSDVSAAKGAFEAGQVSFQEADYDRAILYWEDAFRRDCTALALLLNLGRAYELAGQRGNAISALETYLARRPNAADRDQITRRIEVLRRQHEQEKAAQPDPVPPPQEAEQPAPATVEDRGPSATAPLWPLYVAGGGVVIGVTGAVLWGTQQRIINNCDEISPGEYSCPDQAATDSAQAAQPLRNLGVGLALGGAAAAIGGTVTYFVLRSQANQGAALAPSFAPGYAGLTYARTF